MTRMNKAEFAYETGKVFYLEDNEIVELETPIMMDLTQLVYGKLKVTTKSSYPVNQFVNVDITLVRTRFSLIGKVLESVRVAGSLYEITILIEALPKGVIAELRESITMTQL